MNKGTKEQQNKGTKEQRNKGTKKQKVHPIGSGITRSPGLVSDLLSLEHQEPRRQQVSSIQTWCKVKCTEPSILRSPPLAVPGLRPCWVHE